ncbi:MAG: thioredoxin fold domain-containing protein [Pseudomonadota bacterium]
MKPLSRRMFAALTGAVLAGPAFARDSALPVPGSLLTAGLAAAAVREPLVLLVSLPGCPYCELVRRNYLLPMRAEGLHAWQLDVTDRRLPVQDFTGQPSTGAALAARWRASFTPTVLFFDARGTELADRLTGIASPDFYGSYLDDAISRARQTLSVRS